MAQPRTIDIDPANVVTDHFVDGGTGTTLTLANTSAGDGLAHKLNITDVSTMDQSGKVFTVTGTDADGKAQTEDVTGPGSDATVETTKYFLTVSSITVDGAATAVDIGFVDEVATPTVMMNWRGGAVTHTIVVTGTINYTIHATNVRLNRASRDVTITDQESYLWVPTATASDTASQMVIEEAAPVAYRMIVNSYTDTAEIQWGRSQAVV